MVQGETPTETHITITGDPGDNESILREIQEDPSLTTHDKGHITSITFGPDTSTLRKTIADSNVTSDVISKNINSLLRFIESPIITDTFKDGDDRREWRGSLLPEIRSFVELNKLRKALLLTVDAVYQILDLTLEDKGFEWPEQIKKKVRKLHNSLSHNVVKVDEELDLQQGQEIIDNPYEELKLNEKIIFIHDTEELAEEMIMYLCEKYGTPIE